jgi:transposase InsO family protein
MRFRFIEDRRADYPVTIMCDVLGISPAGYYAWRARPESPRAAANRKLLDDIKQVHRDTNGRYGSPRVHAELRAQGHGTSRGRIERLMRRHGIRAIMARPWRVRTTDSRHDFPIAPNLLARKFIATAPNRIWLADVTYIETDQGWSSWICTAAGSSAGRWRTICVPSCRWQLCAWPSRCNGQAPA